MSTNTIDVTQALKNTENALRDFISLTLFKELGDGWERKCGVTEEKQKRWKERREEEMHRQLGEAIDERLLYYADFYDLITILEKNWSYFEPVFVDIKNIVFNLKELNNLRDLDAHRRELLPHQKHLILGISGEIRSRLVRYRSKQETGEDYYPRIESARDNLGNMWTPRDPGIPASSHRIHTGRKLRPGDLLEFVITAYDPLGEEIEYAITYDIQGYDHIGDWQSENKFTFTVNRGHIGRSFSVNLSIRSKRSYHAKGNYDDIRFFYEVLPPKE